MMLTASLKLEIVLKYEIPPPPHRINRKVLWFRIITLDCVDPSQYKYQFHYIAVGYVSNYIYDRLFKTIVGRLHNRSLFDSAFLFAV